MEEKELLDWAASMGITDAAPAASPGSQSSCLGRSLTISTFPDAGGRGLGAVRDLKEGELILRVPKNALLSLHSAKEDPDLATALLQHQNLSSTQVLTIHLLREVGKGRTSKWYPYLKSLPRFYHTLAQFSGFETKALQVEDAIWIAEQAVERAGKEWEEARPMLQMLALKDRFTSFKAWLWASATVSSRTLHVPWDTAGTLCPIGDLFNYAAPGVPFKDTAKATARSSEDQGVLSETQLGKLKKALSTGLTLTDGSECLGCDETTKIYEMNNDAGSDLQFTERLTDGGYEAKLAAYCLYAREDYRQGDQVLLCYGLYNNLELLEHYGFVLPHNPNDKVYISLHSFQDSTHENNFLGSLKLGPHGSLHIQVDGRPSFPLLAALRLLCVSVGLRRSRGHLAFSGMQISVESDITAYHWLQERCRSLLTSLPTSLDGDTVLLDIITMCSSSDGLAGLMELLGTDRENSFQGLQGQAGWKLLEDSICGWTTLPGRDQQRVLDEIQNFMQFHTRSQNSVNRRVRTEVELWVERFWLTVQWRWCHKKILHRCISFCDQQLQLLNRHKAECKVVEEVGQKF